MTLNILLTKETKAGERRVALIPEDVQCLISQGHKVYVEQNAGVGADFSDQDYEAVGAIIRTVSGENIASYRDFFKDIHIVVRAKRPTRDREIFENQIMNSGTILIGALDPFEKNAPHFDEYYKAGIIPYSIDQLDLSLDDPMNLLAAMSRISGRLALLDAIKKFRANSQTEQIKKVVIIGFGVVGQSAFREAVAQKLPTTIVMSHKANMDDMRVSGAEIITLNRNDNLQKQQSVVSDAIADADIVITSARKATQLAPLLIPSTTLKNMKKGCVIVDMAISEGGNVEGSEHDETHILGNGVLVTNVSGYPKQLPYEASIQWSAATLKFLRLLIDHAKKTPLIIKHTKLTGNHLTIEPLEEKHIEELRVLFDPEIWKWYPFEIKTKEQFTQFMLNQLKQQELGDLLCYVIREKASGQLIGSSAFLRISKENRRVEIGSTWFAPEWQRTFANTETKLLMLTYAFEELKCISVQLQTDSRNMKSRKAIERLGAKFDGVLRYDRVCENGRIRDSAFYSITYLEWPEVKKKMMMIANRDRD